ncbi:MAG: rhodanese-like domain-containing protein [Myxococcota bacterium]|nr:rhodanese-like domain-containing protein [Myxococcota bacterium]
MTIPQITPLELAARLAAEPELVVLDVRPADEVARAALPGAVNIPAGALASRLIELDPDVPVVVICHFGMRSMAAAAFLLDRDFDDVASLTGGIDLYARDVDTTLPRY